LHESIVANLHQYSLNDVNDYDASDNELKAESTKERIGRHVIKLFPQHSQVRVLVNLENQRNVVLTTVIVINCSN